ncbi:cytochrome-c peroxidase [Myxococcota bacterium]|nr:cytochrome-c peroxidase [Myxococcota bacterium]MBU1897088.1 cytochrome-c peroxidase [Myxococcota bacterium]
MPPMRYLAMHWNHGLSAQDKLTLSKWIAATRAARFQSPGVAKPFATHPLQPLRPLASFNADKVEVGEKLYHDVRLSGDNTVSCASCHDLARGGVDRLQFSKGIKGQVGGINAPTVYNSGTQFVQFWDGRAKDLKDQAGGPVENPIEMGAKWADVLPKLKADPELNAKLVQLYGEDYKAEHIQDAIAAFEATLVTPSRFDAFMRGDDKALSAEEKQGFEIFTDKGCARCHVGEALGGQSFEKMGLYKDYFAGRQVGEADLGRYNVTKDEHDKMRFKTPILRNIAVTQPYLHDGSTSDLREVVKIMSTHQLKAPLTEAEIDAVTAFLKSLTGTWRGAQLQ